MSHREKNMQDKPQNSLEVLTQDSQGWNSKDWKLSGRGIEVSFHNSYSQASTISAYKSWTDWQI